MRRLAQLVERETVPGHYPHRIGEAVDNGYFEIGPPMSQVRILYRRLNLPG